MNFRNLLASAVFWFVIPQIVEAQQQAVHLNRKAPPIERKGLAVVFDASESICGYFGASNTDRKLLDLVKWSTAQRDPDANHRIFLLKQQVKNVQLAARDLVEASANLQAQSQLLAEQPSKSGAKCAPFNGVGSNLELIFDPTAPNARAQGTVLITDGQMKAKDRDAFVKGFVAWATQVQADGMIPYAGVALIQTQFAGRYYSETEPDEKRRVAGYELPVHTRPLLIMWFVRGAALVPMVRGMIDAIGGSKTLSGDQGFVQHLLPLPTDGEAWLTSSFNLPLQLRSFVETKPAYEFKLNDKDRSTKVLNDCLSAVVSETSIAIEASQTCADGKPLFDGVAEIIARFNIPSKPHFHVRVKGASPTSAPVLAWRLDTRAYGDSLFQFVASSSGADKVGGAVAKFSVDSDHCVINARSEKNVGSAASTASTIESCVDRLDGKTYQLDILLNQLLNRRQPVSEAMLAPFADRKFTFTFKQRAYR